MLVFFPNLSHATPKPWLTTARASPWQRTQCCGEEDRAEHRGELKAANSSLARRGSPSYHQASSKAPTVSETPPEASQPSATRDRAVPADAASAWHGREIFLLPFIHT